MSDINNYDNDYIVDEEEREEEYDEEQEENGRNPEKLMKIIIGAVVVAAVVVVVLVCLLFGANSGKDDETTTIPGETTTAADESTTAAGAEFTAGSYTVTVPGNGNLNLRNDASMEAEALIEVPHGTLLNVSEVKHVVTSQNEEQYWGKTVYLGWNGWVSMTYLTKAYSDSIVTPPEIPEETTETPEIPEQTTETPEIPEQTTAVPEEPEQTTASSTNSGRPQTTGTYIVDVDPDPGKVNMRDNHSVEATQIASIPAGTEITVTEVYHDSDATAKELEYWGKVSYGGYTGWISMWYLK